MGFQSYMDDVMALLRCNDQDPKKFRFDFKEHQINIEKLYFFQSFRHGLSAYESLMGFHTHLTLEGKCQSTQ